MQSARRHIGLGLTAVVVLGLVLIASQPAGAGVRGGCTGSADFALDGLSAYGPDNDTRGNPIVVPKTEGETVMWKGSVPGENRNFSGDVEIRVGPAWIKVASWGQPDYDGSNDDDVRSDDGTRDMDEIWDEVPGGRNIVNGIYEARARHLASGVECSAGFFVKFGGNPWSSPVVLGLIALALALSALLIVAGRRRPSPGWFRGRPVLAVIVGVLLGLVLAVLFQQLALWPLDNLALIGLPLLTILVGLVLAKAAPFGRTQGLAD